MGELLTAQQMRAVEGAAMASGMVTGLELMERAGRGVVDAIYERWPNVAGRDRGASPSGSPRYLGQEKEGARPVVVLCGPGNNGGDGFVIARLLHERGWAVDVFLYGDAAALPPDARVNYERWRAIGDVLPWTACTSVRWAARPLVIDAVFGTGLSRVPPDEVRDVLMAVLNCPVVAVDMPSVLGSDSGQVMGGFPRQGGFADLTVTFHRRKLGHVLGEGPGLCGAVAVVDIGLDALVSDAAVLVGPAEGVEKCSGHKFSHGHALIVAGRSGKGGAARLAARGALRIGAGLVTVAPTPGALQENAARLDAVMLSPVGDAQSLQTVLADERLNALCLGPGLGGERARDMVPVALAAQRPTVLDADALTAFRDDPSVLFDMLHDTCVLTPHAGEFARLFPDIAEKLNAPAIEGPAFSKVDATREAAARAGCVVLFKGADTVIAAPDGRCSINAAAYERSAPWLATAGSGDVLAGFITGLLARGFAPKQAAQTAAWLHVECAIQFGPGLIAEDLPEVLPRVFKALSQVPSPS